MVLSVSLTTLEQFVIGASCLWYLSSAVIMAAILLVPTMALPEPQAARAGNAGA